MRPDWHPEDIRAAIKKTGFSIPKLSRHFGYSEKAISVALYYPWPKVEALVAQHLGVSPTDIWPSRYDAEGNPLPGPSGKPRVPSTAEPALPQRKSGRAA